MFYAMMGPLHSSTWQVLADESGLARLRELNKRYALVFLPGPPLLRRHAGARRRARPQRLPAQPRDGRREPPHLADQRPGPPGRHRVHPAQLRRRRDLQVGGPGVLRVPAVQAVQPGVVLRGRPLAHRQDPPPRYGLLRYVAEAVAERPRRGRLPGAGLDHLRPAARGRGDGRRAGRGQEAGRGADVAGRVRPVPAADARRLGPRPVRRADRDAVVAAAGRRLGRRQPGGAAQDRVRGGGRHQPHLAADGERAAGARAARRARPVAHARPDPADPRPVLAYIEARGLPSTGLELLPRRRGLDGVLAAWCGRRS